MTEDSTMLKATATEDQVFALSGVSIEPEPEDLQKWTTAYQ